MGRAILSFILHAIFWAIAYAVFGWPGVVVCLLASISWAVTRFARAHLARQAAIAQAAVRNADIASIGVPGGRVSFKTMTLTLGDDEEYALRRVSDGRWEGRPLSATAVSEVVSKRLDALTDKQHEDSVVRFAELLAAEEPPAKPDGTIPVEVLGNIMKRLPAGTRGRKVVRELIEQHLKGVLSTEDYEKMCKGHKDMEILQAISDLMEDNESFEHIPSLLESIVEAAYQRYIHHG